jgi:alpha-tubulin suppressor-like RCC1 family protein
MTINANNLVIQVNSLLANCAISNTDLDNAILAGPFLNRVKSRTKCQMAVNSTFGQGSKGNLVFNPEENQYYYNTGAGWETNFNLNRDSLTAARWGLNFISCDTQINFCNPCQVAFTGWCQLSTFKNHTVAVKTDGTAWSWGCGNGCKLGNTNGSNRASPEQVFGGIFVDWCQVSSGDEHSAGVRQNGTLWTWGGGLCGKLGTGTLSNSGSPVSVVGGFTDWCQVSAGDLHTAAVRTNGTLWTWGYNFNGRLGDGTTIDKSSPVSVVGGFTDWCQVSVGNRHTMAVRQNGSLWGFGSNQFFVGFFNVAGALGDGTTTPRSSPVSVVGGFTDWCQVSAGYQHTAAVRTNGTLWTWGVGCNGKLGDGATTCKLSPVSVAGGFVDWCQVSTGNQHTAAVRQNGTLWTWGLGTCGRLGDGTTVTKCSPVSVVSGFTNWCQVTSGCLLTNAIFINRICPYI